MRTFKVSTVSSILTFVLFAGGMQFESADLAYGQETNKTFIEDEYGLPNGDTVKKILQYCRFVNDYGANDGKEDITGDLVDTGKISAVYKDWTCDDAKDQDKRFENLKNSLDDYLAMEKELKESGK